MNILEASRNGSSGLGGMVSRALTANDPLNDQRERERETRGMETVIKIFNNLHINVFDWSVIQSDQLLMCATYSLCGVGTESVFSFFLICR